MRCVSFHSEQRIEVIRLPRPPDVAFEVIQQVIRWSWMAAPEQRAAVRDLRLDEASSKGEALRRVGRGGPLAPPKLDVLVRHPVGDATGRSGAAPAVQHSD